MIVTILDLGTNTFNALIVDINDNQYNIIYYKKFNIKLGEHTIDQGIISEAAFQRGLNALVELKALSSEHNSERIIAIGTSALRSSSNSCDFVKAVKEKTNINIQIIDGNTEAELISRGVKLALPEINQKYIIIDIGGGSTEFIITHNNQILWKKSYDLGVARLLSKFKPSDPITKKEIDAVEKYLETELTDLFSKIKEFEVKLLVGSSGSFDTFAEMIIAREQEPIIIESIKGYDFNIKDYLKIHSLLINSNKEERLKMKGLIEMRVDMIVLSTIFVNLFLKKANIQEMKLSTYSLKEGIVYNILNNL
ncbi:MAG: exopolyphosphatase [Bacteroidota bacterium]